VPVAQANTSLTVYYEKTGNSYTYAAPTHQVRLGGSPQHLGISAVYDSDFRVAQYWGAFLSVDLWAPPGDSFRPGVYLDVGCYGLASGRSATMHITENNPNCRLDSDDNLWGWISIRQIEFSEGGQVSKLEAVFSERWGGPDAPGNVFTVFHNARPRSFSVRAERKSKFGVLAARTYHGDESILSFSGTSTSFSYQSSAPKNHWTLAVDAASGAGLSVGRFATTSHFDPGTGWKMTVSKERGLSEPSRCLGPGTIEVTELMRNDTGAVTSIRGTYEQQCAADNTKMPPHNRVAGEFRFDL